MAMYQSKFTGAEIDEAVENQKVMAKEIVDNAKILEMLGTAHNFINYLPQNSEDWEQGSIDGDSGEVVESSSRVRTKDFIEVKSHYLAIAFGNTNYKIMIYLYDKNYNFICKYGYYFEDITRRIEPNTKYIKVLLAPINDIVNDGTVSLIDTHLCAVITPHIPTESNPVKFKVMQYNVGWFWDGLTRVPTDKVASQTLKIRMDFAKNNCDIVGICEMPEFFDIDKTLDPYEQVLANMYNSTGWTMPGLFQIALTKSFPITDRYEKVFWDDTSVHGFISWDCNIHGKSVKVIQAHFPIRENAKYESVCVANMLDYLATLDSFVLLGDFNATPEDYTIYTNLGYNIANCGWLGNLKTCQTTGNEYPDNIITSSDIKICNVWVGDEDVIDHAPLCAELEFTI